MPLKPEVREEVIRLLKEDKSKSHIQRVTGVSRVTITKIEKTLLLQEESITKAPPVIEYTRCKGCGGKVITSKPCLTCELRGGVDKSYDEYMESLLGPITQ